MKLKRFKCPNMACSKEFYCDIEDIKQPDLLCPFCTWNLVNRCEAFEVLEMGEIEFDDQFKLSSKAIEKIKTQLEGVLHNIENLNKGMDEAYLQKELQLKIDLEANKNES